VTDHVLSRGSKEERKKEEHTFYFALAEMQKVAFEKKNLLLFLITPPSQIIVREYFIDTRCFVVADQ
jgi:hypothetical protein